VFAATTPAQPAPSTSINGAYNGTLADAQGAKTVKLALQIATNGSLTGVLTFFPTPTSHDPTCSYGVGGSFDAASGKINLRPLRWLTPPPAGFRMTGILGTFDSASGRISGTVTGGRGTFEATRDPAESPILAGSVKPPNSTGGAQASPRPAAVAASVAANDPSVLAALNGVYTGTYSCVDGTMKLKLSLKSTDDGSLSGLFTFDLPAWAGARPATYKLTGRYVAGNRFPFQFTTVEPLGAPAPPAYAMTAVNAKFGVGQYVMGPNGLQDGVNLDHLQGSTPGKGSVSFNATRDKAGSADLDNVMAAQAGAALTVTTTAAAPTAPMARLHSIDGVYNGTFAGKEGPIKFKLTITQKGGGKLAAVATVDLPADSGTKAVTYNLEGVNEPENHHHFALHARQGEASPPVDNAPVEFGGTFVPDLAHNAARLVSATRSGIRFEATWDAAETAASDAARAAQEKVDAAAHAVALKAFDEVMANARPKELASRDLVRKSKAYWENYDTDMVREVFDGGFGADIVDDQQFQKVFCTYVEMFAAKFPDCLPANRQRVNMTWRTNRKFDEYGHLSSEENHDYSVDMDPRFVEKFLQCSAALNSKGAEIREVFAAMQPGGTQRVLHDLMALAQDVQRFLADNGGKSAATRQMNENFLRAINGELSLQQAGGKIDGAQAESDRDLPPGRFARFVDGANAFYRDPANARYRGRNDTAFCQAMAVRFEFKLSRDEEYYYANDFKSRFYDQIMQPQEKSTDPNWSLLHPVVEECIAETQ
jgi:uncharacterized protein with FMN-binding domain